MEFRRHPINHDCEPAWRLQPRIGYVVGAANRSTRPEDWSERAGRRQRDPPALPLPFPAGNASAVPVREAAIRYATTIARGAPSHRDASAVTQRRSRPCSIALAGSGRPLGYANRVAFVYYTPPPSPTVPHPKETLRPRSRNDAPNPAPARSPAPYAR